jgi:hypothetical protein
MALSVLRALPLFLVVPVALVAACGGDDPPAAPPPENDAGTTVTPVEDGGTTTPDASAEGYSDPTGKSGTRLRRRYLEAGPGAYRTLDFFDKELEVPCAFQEAADGELRCLPRRLAEVYYLDAACSGELVILTDGDSNPCGHELGTRDGKIYRRTTTPKTVDGNILYYPSVGGGCLGSSVSPEAKAWAAEELPSARFVKGTTKDEPREGMTARFVEGEDGSRMLLTTLDTARDVRCDFDAELGRCLPPQRAALGSFSNATCTTPVASQSKASPEPPLLFASRRTAAGCVASTDYFEPGAQVGSEVQLYRRNTEGACEAHDQRIDLNYYARGAAVSLSSFPVVKTRNEGTGTIRARRRLDAADAPIGQAFAFWDAENDRECQVGQMTDGSYRCIPTSSASYEFSIYSDATCSANPLGTASACTSGTAPYVRRIGTAWSCAADLITYEHVYERGPLVEGDVYFGNEAVACAPRAQVTSLRYYSLGSSLPSETFPRLELKTE